MARLLASLLICAPWVWATTGEESSTAASVRFDGGKSAGSTPGSPTAAPAPATPAAKPLSKKDDAFLEDLSRRNSRFFWEQADVKTGLVLDRARADGKAPHSADSSHVASIASTGFGLSALCAAADRGWVAPKQARERAKITLRFLLNSVPQEHGFFYHFINVHTGYREWQSEISSIDTTLLLCGVMTARQHFNDAEIQELAGKILDRVDWNWMLKAMLLSMI